jgi:hypothetical protein
VCVEARSVVPFEWLELVVCGKVIGGTAPSGDPCTASLELDVPVTACAWLAARCRGSHLLPQRPAAQRVFAHTSPAYATIPGQKVQPEPAAIKRLVGNLDKMLEWVAREARCPTEKHRADLTGVFSAARQELLRRGGESP